MPRAVPGEARVSPCVPHCVPPPREPKPQECNSAQPLSRPRGRVEEGLGILTGQGWPLEGPSTNGTTYPQDFGSTDPCTAQHFLRFLKVPYTCLPVEGGNRDSVNHFLSSSSLGSCPPAWAIKAGLTLVLLRARKEMFFGQSTKTTRTTGAHGHVPVFTKAGGGQSVGGKLSPRSSAGVPGL